MTVKSWWSALKPELEASSMNESRTIVYLSYAKNQIYSHILLTFIASPENVELR
jgi:hypothetical protein